MCLMLNDLRNTIQQNFYFSQNFEMETDLIKLKINANPQSRVKSFDGRKVVSKWDKIPSLYLATK